jgi:hypothetical protein
MLRTPLRGVKPGDPVQILGQWPSCGDDRGIRCVVWTRLVIIVTWVQSTAAMAPSYPKIELLPAGVEVRARAAWATLTSLWVACDTGGATPSDVAVDANGSGEDLVESVGGFDLVAGGSFEAEPGAPGGSIPEDWTIEGTPGCQLSIVAATSPSFDVPLVVPALGSRVLLLTCAPDASEHLSITIPITTSAIRDQRYFVRFAAGVPRDYAYGAAVATLRRSPGSDRPEIGDSVTLPTFDSGAFSIQRLQMTTNALDKGTTLSLNVLLESVAGDTPVALALDAVEWRMEPLDEDESGD